MLGNRSEGRIIGSDYSTYVDFVTPPACRAISNGPFGAEIWTLPPGETKYEKRAPALLRMFIDAEAVFRGKPSVGAQVYERVFLTA